MAIVKAEVVIDTLGDKLADVKLEALGDTLA